jgi:hypothetical protein
VFVQIFAGEEYRQRNLETYRPLRETILDFNGLNKVDCAHKEIHRRMRSVLNYLRINLIFIVPLMIIGLIAYVFLSPDKPAKPCLSVNYVVAEIMNPDLVYSGKVTLKYTYVYKNKESEKSYTRHYTNLPPENFDRFYILVCVKDSSDVSFDVMTDSIPVKPWHRLGVEYPGDSIGF